MPPASSPILCPLMSKIDVDRRLRPTVSYPEMHCASLTKLTTQSSLYLYETYPQNSNSRVLEDVANFRIRVSGEFWFELGIDSQ